MNGFVTGTSSPWWCVSHFLLLAVVSFLCRSRWWQNWGVLFSRWRRIGEAVGPRWLVIVEAFRRRRRQRWRWRRRCASVWHRGRLGYVTVVRHHSVWHLNIRVVSAVARGSIGYHVSDRHFSMDRQDPFAYPLSSKVINKTE